MNILYYNELDSTPVRKQYEKVVAMLQQDDFYSAEVKKLTGTPYYRAKLDDTNRLLFKIVQYQGKRHALLLEIILQHAYEKSRFLKGAVIDETKIGPLITHPEDLTPPSLESMAYLNPKQSTFHILNKIVSLDEAQETIFHIKPPVIIIGSAGSGKTLLTLEKMKVAVGNILYVTGSPYLVHHARELYYSYEYANELQEIDFLSYRELVETIQIPIEKEMTFPLFSAWLQHTNKHKKLQDANKLYEEFKGVLTGNHLEKAFLSRADYLALGIKQSIYHPEERDSVYDVFEKYLHFLKTEKRYDSNLLSFAYLARCQPTYDFIVVDEVQDFTPVQLALILKNLKHPQAFMLCGDSNQIVHPNFFSWAKIKTLFYQQATESPAELIRLLTTNYRNASAITQVANTLLKIKNSRFGSIDKESHYLVESQSQTEGAIYCLQDSPAIRHEINTKTSKSTQFAVIVMQDEQKADARHVFNTPLIFSIFEAKGLEYDNVILYGFISHNEKKFRDITQGVSSNDLKEEVVYGRVKDKADRSLEVYKFYVNALYVAITRAIKHVYFIEHISQHPLFDLLGLTISHEFIATDYRASSLDDWQKEAQRLELQGKQDQAEAIRQIILHTKEVPWTVLRDESLSHLRNLALDTERKDKSARLTLFEYALAYNDAITLSQLAAVGFAPAQRPEKGYALLERKYFMGYGSGNYTSVLRQTEHYGVDFRNVFNQTPLMLAAKFGNASLCRTLKERGATLNLTDNRGRNAFQMMLQEALLDKHVAQHKLAPLYAILSPDSISIQAESKLIKIDVQRMEFFLLNAMIGLMHAKARQANQAIAFTVDHFLIPLAHFPDSIMPERRKKRAYISSILAKNEISRDTPYNRKLFLRVKIGFYVLNPHLFIKVNEEWVNVSRLLTSHAVSVLSKRSSDAETNVNDK